MGLLHAESYSGNITYNPFSFQRFGLINIKQLVRGEDYPYETLELNQADTQKDLEGYFRFLLASEIYRKAQPSMITSEMWGGAGCCKEECKKRKKEKKKKSHGMGGGQH